MESNLRVELIDPTENSVRRDGIQVFSGRLIRRRVGKTVRFDNKPPQPAPPPRMQPAQVAQMLALAYRFRAMLDDGSALDQTDLAKHYNMTRARVTQILDLALIAPDIQAEVLDLTGPNGKCRITERRLRDIVRSEDWQEQRRQWQAIRPRIGAD